MKKVFTFASFALIMGLGFIGYKNTPIDKLLDTEETGEKTYIVKVEGNVVGTEEEKAEADKNRKQVLSELALKLGEDSYEVTYVYDAVYNGFAIKTTSDKAEILKETLNVSSVEQEHTYSLPDGTETAVNFSSASDASIKQQKLANYSSETMHSTKEDIESVVGVGNYKGGEGITIGILDTGLYLNQVEGNAARTALENDSSLNTKINAAAFKPLASGVETKFTQENLANVTGKNFKYINNKIPYSYDYAGNDNDVDPTSNGSNHGTHVASLAGANGDDFQGIAPNAQIAVMKVFGDGSGGAASTDVIAAINDAKKLGLDEINMSLGTDLLDCGMDVDGIDSASYQALKDCSDAGVICNISAGNAGKSSFSSGNYSDYTTDIVEGGILGSYANFDETANIVASSNPDRAFYSSIMQVTQDGSSVNNAVSYSDQVVSSTTQTFLKDRYLTDLLGYVEASPSKADFDDDKTSYYTKNENGIYVQCKSTDEYSATTTYYVQDNSTEKEYVVIPGYGESKDYTGLDVQGKVAVVHRGNTTFVQKYQTAEANGAIALVVINNSPSTTFNFSMAFSDNSPNIPVVFVFQNSTSSWGSAGTTGTIKLMRNQVTEAGDGNTVSSYSSDGPSSNLDIGPTISAPGSQVIGAVSAAASNAITGGTSTGVSGLYGYENMSGTSMASPNLTGALAAALGQKKAEIYAQADKTDAQKADEFKEYKTTISKKAMSTADQLVDGAKEAENSPRMQGAGRINVESLLTADSYVEVPNADTDGFTNTTQSKAELKNSGTLYVKDGDFSTAGEAYIEFDYTIHNDSSKAKTYTPSLSVMIPKLEISTTHASYAAEQADSRKEEVGYSDSVTFDENDKDTYPTFVGTPTMSVNDDTVLSYEDSKAKISENTVTVAANSTKTAHVKVRIDDLHFEKDWNDGDYIDNFSGTLKDYISKYFSNAAGTYVEGFLKLTENSDETDNETLTVPYLGFYGDYASADAVEPFDFEKEDSVVDGKYNSKYHVYNSDLANNYLQHLNENYKKPNAYTGSALSASANSLTSTQLTNISNFTASPAANGSDLLSVVDSSKTHIYAGSASSQHLNAFFYVNRSVSDAKWYIKDASGKNVGQGSVNTLMMAGTSAVSTDQYGLVKSWITTNDTGYTMNRGYADINVSSIPEGNYSLEFSFTLKGAKDSKGNAVTQTKSYDLVIDKTAPTITSISTVAVGTGTRLVVTSKGANDTIKIGSSALVPELVEGTTDTYQASSRLLDSAIKADKVNVTLSDYAHNTTIVMVHISNLTFSVSSTFFTDKNDFVISEVDSNTNMYTVEILDKNGNSIEPAKLNAYTLHIQLATNIALEDIEVKLDGEVVDSSYYSYDASTGLISITIKKGTVSFQINQKPQSKSDSDSSNSSNSSSSSSNTSNSTSSSSDTKKKGCGGSIIAASSVVASLGLVGVGLLLKKKKEEK